MNTNWGLVELLVVGIFVMVLLEVLGVLPK